MVNRPDKKFRQVEGRDVADPANVNNLTYNQASGAFKSIDGGYHLKPIPVPPSSFTTNAVAAKSCRKGTTIAIYNNSGAMQTFNFGESSSVTTLAIGISDASGNVGIPCKPNDWTYLNSNEKEWFITSSANLIIFFVEDETYITSQRQ